MCNNNGYRNVANKYNLQLRMQQESLMQNSVEHNKIISCEKSKCSSKGHIKRNAGKTECSEGATIIF
jgi:hypothetical protein